MLRNKSQSIEQSAMKIVANEEGKLASLYGRIDIDSSPAIRGRLLADCVGRRSACGQGRSRGIRIRSSGAGGFHPGSIRSGRCTCSVRTRSRSAGSIGCC